MARWPLLLVLTLAACMPAAAPPSPLPRVPVTEAMVVAPAASDGALHFYRNYFALSEVGQVGRHYELYYLDVEQVHASAVVVAAGIAFTGGDFGGMSSPPKGPTPIPPSFEAEAERVEAAFLAQHPSVKSVRMTYSGEYRLLVLHELYAVSKTPGSLVGWKGDIALRADANLTHVEGLASGMSSTGFGLISVPKGSARIDYAPPPAGGEAHLVVDSFMKGGAPAELVEKTLAVARDVVANKPVPSFDAMLTGPLDEALPADFDEKIVLAVSVYGRRADGKGNSGDGALRFALHPRDTLAAGGKATATATTTVDGVHISGSATMSAFGAPTVALPKHLAGRADVREAMITIHLDDGRGHIIDRTYPARGPVVMQDEIIALPVGLELPGTSSPSPEADALRFHLPGTATSRSIDVYVGPGLSNDPR